MKNLNALTTSDLLMAPIVIDLQNAENDRDVIHQAVAALSAGKIIAVPTETVYGLAASALVPEAVARLFELKGRSSDKPLTYAVKSYEAALDYVPKMSTLARRLARRCWPGPLTMVLDSAHPDSVIQRLEPSVRQATVPRGTAGLRVPDHETTLQIMRLCAGPIVLTSANLSGQSAATTGKQVELQLGDQIDLILDDGPTKLQQDSSVVAVTDNRLDILRQGVINEPTLRQLSGFTVLVVCTGNTCRSPMAEALLKKQVARALNCGLDDLQKMGVNVISAGIAANPGSPPARQAHAVMQEMGLDISQHVSQPITGRLAQHADVILTMTNNHRDALMNHWPMLGTRVHTLCRNGADVSDPIGAPVDIYRSCAQQIDDHLSQWADAFDFSLSPFDGLTS